MDDIIDYFQLETHLNVPRQVQKITKKTLLESPNLTALQKRYIKKEIESLTIEAILNPTTINIPAFSNDQYHYQEIAIIRIVFFADQKRIHEHELSEALAALIQNPTIFIIEKGNQSMIRINVKRRHKSIISQSVFAYSTRTEWGGLLQQHPIYQGLDISIYSFKDLYTFHTQLASYIQQSILRDILGEIVWTPSISYERFKELMQPYQNTQGEINRLTQELKGTTEIGQRASLKQAIIDQETILEIQKERMREELSGNRN